ncbi:hypothetical protein D7X94_11885 [Acutalibacter sp. 1XD8-33]|nr:hypothetical protein D7X94_11885 [Acutalibacter sp. 1XD8-33]
MAESGAARYFQSVFFRLLPFGGSWRTAAHAYAYYSHKKNVFGEWVFGCQRTAGNCKKAPSLFQRKK